MIILKKDSSGNFIMNNKSVINASERSKPKKKTDKITLSQNMDANNFNIQNFKSPVMMQYHYRF